MLIFCSNDLYSELFSKVLFKRSWFSGNREEFENRHFSIAVITEEKCKRCILKSLEKLNVSTSINELWRNVSTPPCLIKSMN